MRIVRHPLVIAAAAALSFSGYLLAQSVQSNAPVYLALGDSYPFGSRCDTTPCVAGENLAALVSADNDNFFVGYPDYLQLMIDRPLINAWVPWRVYELVSDPGWS